VQDHDFRQGLALPGGQGEPAGPCAAWAVLVVPAACVPEAAVAEQLLQRRAPVVAVAAVEGFQFLVQP